MRWLCATAGILAVFAAGAVWIYFRDWQRPRADAAERALALIDGKRAFCCGHRRWQRVEILDTDGERHWRLRLSGPRARRCYWLDLDAFEPISAGRFAGIRRVRCGAAIAALGPPRSPDG